VVRVSHGGAAQARNAGLAAAGGELIRFVDADDVYELDSTARLARLIGPAHDAIAYGATVFCDSDMRPIWTLRARLAGDVTRDILLGRLQFRVQSMVFPRAVLEAAGEWDPALTVSEDWDLLLRAAELAPLRADSGVATYYRDHPGGLTSDISSGLEGARGVVQRYFRRHPEERGTSLERRARAMLDAHAARVHATHGSPLRGLGRLARATVRDPRAVAGEVSRAMPAVRGYLRRGLGRRPSAMTG
jgi:glycosyltransferase involved in cell wall biosynthesis